MGRKKNRGVLAASAFSSKLERGRLFGGIRGGSGGASPMGEEPLKTDMQDRLTGIAIRRNPVLLVLDACLAHRMVRRR